MNMPFLVFDVESIGLHGEAFAVAGVLPAHHSLADVRQSVRLLQTALKEVSKC